MSIADFQSVMRPLLEAVQHGAPLPLGELREWIIFRLKRISGERLTPRI